jgi:zinc protease
MVAYFTAVKVGSRNELEPGMTGFAHFFEHMMFKGTRNWPGSTREALLGSLGFSENAYTSDDLTMYHLVGPNSGLDKLIEVEADRFKNLEYSEPVFQTEAKAVNGEYLKNASNPYLKLNETLRANAFKTHSYRHTTLGFYEDIQAMPTRYGYSLEFFKRWYAPDNCIVVVAGDFDDKKLMEQIEKQYGGWTSKAAKLNVPKEPPQTELRMGLVEWKTPTLPRHALYWHTPSTLKDAALQQVLGEYLAGPISPLYKSLVLDKQVVESVGADARQRRDPWLFGLTATLRDESKRPEVDAALLKAVAELTEGKVDEKRLAAVQDNIVYSTILDLETPESVAGLLATAAAVYGSPDAAAQQQDAVRALKAKDLVAFAKTYLNDKNRTSLVLTAPEKGGAR